MNYTMAWIGCQATRIPLSLSLSLSLSLPRWCVLCLALGFYLYYSTALSRALLYPNIGEFVNSGSSWVNWPVREVISDFGEGEGEGEKWIGCFFFLHRYVFSFFFFYVQPEAWHLEFTTCRLHIIHICDIMRSRNLSRIQNSRGCFLSPFFFYPAFHDLQFQRNGWRRTINFQRDKSGPGVAAVSTPTGMFIFPFCEKDREDFAIHRRTSTEKKKKERKKKDIGTCEGYETKCIPFVRFRLHSTPEFPQPNGSNHSSLPLPSLQFHGCNCDLLFREPAFKLSTLKVFHASYHPLIEFKTDACTRSGDIALTSGCTDFTSRHAAETDSGNEI